MISEIHDINPKNWLKQPEWQLIVETHFEDRPDGEITINGPYDSTVFQDEVKKIINHPRWDKPLYSETKNLLVDSPRLYSEFLAQHLHRFIESAKNAMFIKFPETNNIITKSMILENRFLNGLPIGSNCKTRRLPQLIICIIVYDEI